LEFLDLFLVAVQAMAALQALAVAVQQAQTQLLLLAQAVAPEQLTAVAAMVAAVM
jgi:hypothetical protein